MNELIKSENENQIVGCGFGEIRKNDEPYLNKHIGYIGLMYIDGKYRGEGIGKLIISLLFNWFKEKQIMDIRLKVYSENGIAISAYVNYGFKEFVTEMRTVLE